MNTEPAIRSDDARDKHSLRHVAARLAHDERAFSEITARLRELGAGEADAVRIGCQAVRGGARKGARLPVALRPGG